jgi:hypothetical protein
VALQEIVAAIFKIFQTKYMLAIVVQVAWHCWGLEQPSAPLGSLQDSTRKTPS